MLPASFAIVLLAQITPSPGPVIVSAPPKPKLICRQGESQLGTHMRVGRRCKTAQQWQEEEAGARNGPMPPSLTIHKDQLEGAPVTQPQ